MSTTIAGKSMPAGAAIAPYDTAEFLRTPEEIMAYLEAIFEECSDEPRVIVKALGDVARAQGMQKIARVTGLNREGLYKSLSEEGNPSFETVLKVMGAVGIELRPKAALAAASTPRRIVKAAKAGARKRTVRKRAFRKRA